MPHIDANLPGKLNEGSHQKQERQGEHRRHDPPMPDPQKPGEKGENEQRGGGERAQNRKIDGAAQKFHPAHERGGQFGARIAVRVRFSKSLVFVRDAFEARDQNRQERRNGFSMKAGAVACEIASLK